MAITRFEDIQAWQKARELTNLVYAATNNESFSKDFRLKDQFRASSTSVMANIAEGYDSGSDPEFIRFLNYARRSASETQSHAYVAHDQGYISESEFAALYQLATEAKKLINGFIRYLHNSPRKRQQPTTTDYGLRTND